MDVRGNNNVEIIGKYFPESVEEELFELVGRINAFAAYVNNCTFVDRKTCADMLGFELLPDCEMKK